MESVVDTTSFCVNIIPNPPKIHNRQPACPVAQKKRKCYNDFGVRRVRAPGDNTGAAGKVMPISAKKDTAAKAGTMPDRAQKLPTNRQHNGGNK